MLKLSICGVKYKCGEDCEVIKYQQIRLTRRASFCTLGNDHCCRKSTALQTWRSMRDLFLNCVCSMWFRKEASHPVWLGFCYCNRMLLGKVFFARQGKFWHSLLSKRAEFSTNVVLCLTQQPDKRLMWNASCFIQVSECLLNNPKPIPILPITNHSFVFLFCQTCPHPFLSHAISCLL